MIDEINIIYDVKNINAWWGCPLYNKKNCYAISCGSAMEISNYKGSINYKVIAHHNTSLAKELAYNVRFTNGGYGDIIYGYGILLIRPNGECIIITDIDDVTPVVHIILN